MGGEGDCIPIVNHFHQVRQYQARRANFVLPSFFGLESTAITRNFFPASNASFKIFTINEELK